MHNSFPGDEHRLEGHVTMNGGALDPYHILFGY